MGCTSARIHLPQTCSPHWTSDSKGHRSASLHFAPHLLVYSDVGSCVSTKSSFNIRPASRRVRVAFHAAGQLLGIAMVTRGRSAVLDINSPHFISCLKFAQHSRQSVACAYVLHSLAAEAAPALVFVWLQICTVPFLMTCDIRRSHEFVCHVNYLVLNRVPRPQCLGVLLSRSWYAS